jgi:hypothetical protein
MTSRTIAIAGSIAALSFAAAPVTAIAAAKSHDRPATQSRIDRSRDASGLRHNDSSPDRSSADKLGGLRDR